MVFKRFSSHHEGGAALVELALLIPVLIVLVAAIIDLSSIVRLKRIAIETTRQSARVSAQAQDLGTTDPMLADELGLFPDDPCSMYLAAYSGIVPVSLSSYTKLAACEQLEQVSDSADNWAVTVNITDPLIRDGLAPDFSLHEIEVEVTRTGHACTLCFGVAKTLVPKSKSWFYTRVT